MEEQLSEEVHDVIRAGNEKALADLLRKLPSLDYELREALAELLGEDNWAKKFYPYRLKFLPLLKKKPTRTSDDDFMKGVFLGDAQLLRAVLLGAEEFGVDKACVLADLLDPEAKAHGSYPYRLEFRGWGRGRPVDRLKMRASSFTRTLMVKHAQEVEKKQYLAVEKVIKRARRGRATIMADLAKSKRSKNR